MLMFNNSQKGHTELTQSHYMHDYSLLQGQETNKGKGRDEQDRI